jgi:putative MFS transporter
MGWRDDATIAVIASRADRDTVNTAQSTARAAAISARLDRLPSSPYLWRLLVLLSLGAFFEMYHLFLTAYIAPGLVRSHIFNASEKGLFGLRDQAAFA